MAQIRPFRAFRYDLARVQPEDVLTQPYDKISPAMYRRYLERSPYSLARLILPAPPAESHGGAGLAADAAYTAVAERLRAWIAAGILRQDAAPSIYPYRQTFTPPGSSQELTRQGFIALGRLEDYDRRVVFRHEQTLSGPKADRLALLRATRTHFGQIFMLYSDPSQAVEAELWSRAGQPLFEATDEYGTRHTLFQESDAAIIGRLVAAMRDRELVIADGHHRYETALAWSQEQAGAQAEGEAAPPSRFAMMTCINQDAPGVLILPTHRLVSGLAEFDARRFLAFAGESLAVSRLPLSPVHWPNAWPQIEAAMQAADPMPAIAAAALAGTEEIFFFRWRSAADRERLLASYAPAQRQLDVVALHELLLARGLGISADDVRRQRYIGYERDPSAALVAVATGELQAAFLLRPLAPGAVREVALAGGVMPQKSTDFYPKLLSGLTLYRVE